MRERWFGNTGRKVPEIALEGTLDLEDALVLDAWAEDARTAFDHGQPVVVRARTAEQVQDALSHPDVASVLVDDPELLELDLVKLTYG